MSVNPGIPDNMDTFLTPRDIARAIIKRGDFILIITVIATCCGIVTAFMHPPVYDARSELLLKRSSLGTEGEPVDSSPGFPTIATNIRQIYQEGELRTEIVMIKSRDLIIDVMDELQLTREQFDNINDYRKYVRKTIAGTKNAFFSIINELKYFFRLGKRPSDEEKVLKEKERLIEDVINAAVVEQVPESDVISVGFRCSDPFLSQKMSRAICRHAISWHDKMRGQSDENLLFYQHMSDKTRQELSGAEKKLSDLRQDFDLIGADENRGLLVKFKLEAIARHNDAEQRRAALEAGVISLKKEIKKLPENIQLSKTSATNPAWKNISEKIATLKLTKIQDSARFTDEGKKMRDIDLAIKNADSFLNDIPGQIDVSSVNGINDVYKTLEATMLVKSSELAAAEAEIKQIEKSIEGFDKKLTALNEHVFRIKSIERDVAAIESTYDLYLKNTELARVKSQKRNVQLANLVILQNAGLPLRSVKPGKLMYIMLSFLGSLMLGSVFALAKELNDTSYMNTDELERDFGIPALGTISFFNNQPDSEQEG